MEASRSAANTYIAFFNICVNPLHVNPLHVILSFSFLFARRISLSICRRHSLTHSSSHHSLTHSSSHHSLTHSSHHSSSHHSLTHHSSSHHSLTPPVITPEDRFMPLPIIDCKSIITPLGSGIILSRGLAERLNFTLYETCVNTFTMIHGLPKGGDVIMAECL